ncbi:torsin-1A-like [Myxocyprinus asiaticus]|uniref:torsin-1A-like n=1 Tax=Myxocyprinus asiaticus TaxID=70543 RepID=UPI0022225516|nr:torsin-1A-like [Myxocyprinus asiaticus]
MNSGKFVLLFFLLPFVTVEAGFFDFLERFYCRCDFDGFYDINRILSDKDDLQHFDSEELKKDLRKSLYGQHIAMKTIQKAVSCFMKDSNPTKPLVLSFHGPPGVGKSYVTKIIARNIYKKGEKSKHVHTFMTDYYFPHKDRARIYQTQLREWIHGNVSCFPHSMFIFDEINKISSELIDTIKPFLDYNPQVDGVSFNKAIFIFISNSEMNAITNLTLDFWREGRDREEIQITSRGLETQITQNIYNDEKGGFWHSSLIDQHLIDHFIPFLPLELKHVRQCVLSEMAHLNMTEDFDLADKVARDMPFFPPEEKIFAVKGCKSVRQKLALYADD